MDFKEATRGLRLGPARNGVYLARQAAMKSRNFA